MKKKEQKWEVIDPASLPKHFDAAEAEIRWDRYWEKMGVYRYQKEISREKTFVVDTPPPTVSGSLHIGHVFSYTHTDVIVRYQRMKGLNIFYPMGWDDNGLPTERRVQNYFHVTCNPNVAYEKDLHLEQATAKMRKDHAREISRKNFIELCLQLTQKDERAFMDLWRRIGLSVDWQEAYATIDDHCRHLAQLSFLDLYQKGHIYNRYEPTMWDVNFQTAVAQAELEDRSVQGAFHKIAFGIEGEDRQIVIATTRPELLPSCVGVTAHPEDKRFKDLFGKRAITPLFQVPVPIFPSELADPEKGTGILMVCTFGDQTDVYWWKEQGLQLRQTLGKNGRLLPIMFGDTDWESLDPDAANGYYSQMTGKSVPAARKIIVQLLEDADGAAPGTDKPLQGEPEPLMHDVKFYEKGDRPLEFVPTRQWFVRLLDKKDLLLSKGNEIKWHPDHMRLRYLNWTENLQFDWCISRQRYFGVSFPVWYPIDEHGEKQYDKPILARADQLPLDPMSEIPEGYDESQRNHKGGFAGEADVFDTWFTSSLTPQIGSHWLLNKDRHSSLFPMDLRPQAHDIIRTWAFYTIAKAALHENKIPWKHVALSGWILDPDRKKMSKSKGNVVTPVEYVERFTADGIRYWASNSRLGTDSTFDETMLKVGKRLVTKLYNAGKFVLSLDAEIAPIGEEIDRAFLYKLKQLVERTTGAMEKFDFATSLLETDQFFWQNFTDNYLELVKNRAKGWLGDTIQGKDSAVASLRLTLSVLVRLFAPVLPYITEEIWSWVYAKETGKESIHAASWPNGSDFEGIIPPENPELFDQAVACVSAMRKFKTDNSLSAGRKINRLTLQAQSKTLELLKPCMADCMAAAYVENFIIQENAELEAGEFRLLDVDFTRQD